jgi:hypothetical protein
MKFKSLDVKLKLTVNRDNQAGPVEWAVGAVAAVSGLLYPEYCQCA